MTFPSAVADPALAAAIAPVGTLRAAINVGNAVLANRDATGAPVGVSIDLAQAFGRVLGLPVELVVFESAGASVEAVTQQRADIGFFAIDPVRGAGIDFTAAYVVIEGAYLVREESPLRGNEEVDRAAHRVAVGKGSAYDLYLTRELKQARIVRMALSRAVVDDFLAQRLDVAAGVKAQLQSDLRRLPGLRLLPGHFMLIQQAMGLPKGRPPEALQFLRRFVEDAKASGFVAAALARHGTEAAVAPPSDGTSGRIRCA
jgi:polar amino acid transport system substrate-binding protein